jgi:hypothetical protein
MSDELILAHARDFYSKVSKRYVADRYYERLPLNTFWRQQNMPLMCDIIENADGPKELVHRSQQTFMFSVNVAAPIKERAVAWLLAEQRSRGVDIFSLPAEIQESAYSYPGNNVDCQGRRLTPDFIRTVNIGHQIGRYFKPGRWGFDILELGGGLGHLARTMKLLGHTCSHVILDLPETLVFSFCFLSLNFPRARMLLVEDDESARAIAAGGYDFAFVPSLFAEAATARPYDLFVNTASLGEMPNKTIRYWMDFIQNRLDVRYLYTLNRYLNTIDPSRHAWRWEENECSVHYDRRWEMLKWEVEPGFTRCPYVDTVIARYVEIAAARLRTVDDAGCVKHAAELLQLVQEEDWYNVKGDSAKMTRGDHILAHDLGLEGTLFKLWNVLRLQPSADAAATMLRYLETLLAREDRVFEEGHYYEDLFFRLFDPERDSPLQELAAQIRRRQLHARRRQLRLIDSCGSFNFIQAGDDVVAISKVLGQVKLFDERLGEQDLPPVLFVAGSVEEARRKVLGLESLGAGVIEVYHDFNIIWARGGFYGVRQSIGPVEVGREPGIELEREYEGNVVFGDSIEFVRGKIDAMGETREHLAGEKSQMEERLEYLTKHVFAIAPESNKEPRLLEGNHRGFNLIVYDGKVWAVAMAAGPVDFHDTGARERLVAEGRLLEAVTVDGARAAVDRLHDRQAIEAEMFNLSSRLSAQHAELARRHDAALSQLTQWRKETETRLVGDEAMIREYSSGVFYRWIRRLFGVSSSAQEGKNK